MNMARLVTLALLVRDAAAWGFGTKCAGGNKCGMMDTCCGTHCCKMMDTCYDDSLCCPMFQEACGDSCCAQGQCTPDKKCCAHGAVATSSGCVARTCENLLNTSCDKPGKPEKTMVDGVAVWSKGEAGNTAICIECHDGAVPSFSCGKGQAMVQGRFCGGVSIQAPLTEFDWMSHSSKASPTPAKQEASLSQQEAQPQAAQPEAAAQPASDAKTAFEKATVDCRHCLAGGIAHDDADAAGATKVLAAPAIAPLAPVEAAPFSFASAALGFASGGVASALIVAVVRRTRIANSDLTTRLMAV